jgi:hypothetical protein
MEDQNSQTTTPAPCFSRATKKPVNWRTVFAVAAAMRKLQQARLIGLARLKQGAFFIPPLNIKAGKGSTKRK